MADTDRPLAGRVAWVTGAGRGIGQSIALKLAAQGAVPVAIDIDAAAANATAAQCVEGKGVGIACDISDATAVAAAVSTIESETGAADILVNAAGISHNEPIADHNEANWRRLLDTNLTGPFLLTRLVLGGMMQRGFGRIVNITSGSAVRVGEGVAAYGASKAGLIALTKALANEAAKAGVTANAVAPGLVDTPMMREHMPETEMLQQAASESAIANPMGLVLQPQDIAHAVAFLCHPDSRGITGQVLHVNAGAIMLGS